MLKQDSVVTFVPIDEAYLAEYTEGPIRDSNRSLDGEVGIVDSRLVSKKLKWMRSTTQENTRAYITLTKPVVSYVLAGKEAIWLFRILGYKQKEIEGVMKFTTVMDKKTGELVKVAELPNDTTADGYLLGGEIVQHMIDCWDRESAIRNEILTVIKNNCCSSKASLDEIGELNTDGRGIFLVDKYYIDNFNEDTLKESVNLDMVQEIFVENVAKNSVLRYVMQASKNRLQASVVTNVIVLPLMFRERVGGRKSALEKQYLSLQTANSNLINLLKNKNIPLKAYIESYNRLNMAYNNLVYRVVSYEDRKKHVVSLIEKLKGKDKLIRDKMIAKRADYTGRSVVVCDPMLKLDEISIPDRILAKILFYDLIEVLTSLDEVEEAINMTDKDVVDLMESKGLLKEAVAILNRAPTLHRLSMRAYNVKRAVGTAIGVNTLLNEGYNLDHDGDTASTKICITIRGKAEIAGLLHAEHNLFKPSDGKCTLIPRLDMIYGLYTATNNKYKLTTPIGDFNTREYLQESLFKQKIKVWETINYNGEKCIAGHKLLELTLPAGTFKAGQTITSKTIESIVEDLLKIQSNKAFLETLWQLSYIGFKLAKIYPLNVSLITNINMDRVKKPFNVFNKKLERLEQCDSYGFLTQEEFNSEFDSYLDDLKECVESEIVENINGNSNVMIEALNGLHMATKDNYALDNVTPIEDLVDVASYEDLKFRVLNRLIKVRETISYSGERCLAGRKLVELTANVKLSSEINSSNADKYLMDLNTRSLGLNLAKLFSYVDMDDNVTDYRFTQDTPILKALNALTSDDYKIDNDSLEDDLREFKTYESLENALLKKMVSPKDTVMFLGNRNLAGRALVGYVINPKKPLNRQIDSFSIYTFESKELLDLGSKFINITKDCGDRELDKYVRSDYRDGSNTVFRRSGYIDMVESGARGSVSNLVQMFVFKGQIAKANGQPFSAIISNSFFTQLSSLEHYVAAYGSRKGVLDKSIKPQDTGYLERLLGHSPMDIIITEDDCHTTEGLDLTLQDIIKEKKDLQSTEEDRLADARSMMIKMITGRYLVGRDDRLTKKTATEYVNKLDKHDKVPLRSPITCKNPCCSKCYGIDYTLRGTAAIGTAVGFIAAQSIGEPGTQITLKVFQKGGVASRADSNKTESDRVSSKFQASKISDAKIHPEYDPIAWGDGKVIVEPRNDYFNAISIEGYRKKVLLATDIEVKKSVKKGETLCIIPGDVDTKEVEMYLGVKEAQKQMVLYTYLIFNSVTSVDIKHFEVVAASLKVTVVLQNKCNNKDIKVLQPYTQTELARKGLINIMKDDNYVAKELIFGVKTLPIVRASMLNNIIMERVEEGIRRSLILGNDDDLVNPISATIFGKVPMVGTGYNKNYIEDRLEYEKERLYN